jgi:hypothetical protein
MHPTTTCKHGSLYAKFVPNALNVVANPAHMQTGSPHMQILAIFSNNLHDFSCRLWYICIWGSPFANGCCMHMVINIYTHMHNVYSVNKGKRKMSTALYFLSIDSSALMLFTYICHAHLNLHIFII